LITTLEQSKNLVKQALNQTVSEINHSLNETRINKTIIV